MSIWKKNSRFDCMKSALKPFLDFLYPPLCIHCRGVHSENGYFCSTCIGILEMLKEERRCKHCFSAVVSSAFCNNCKSYPIIYQRVASVFEYSGPPATLIKKMKYGSKPYFAEGAAAFMTAQFIELGWPMPDLITSIPMSWLKQVNRGYNQSELLAQALAKFIGVPYRELLSREFGGASQASLNSVQRKSMDENPFALKKSVDLSGIRVLVVDDVLTTGTTLRKCGQALEAGYPSSLYALTFCRA